LFEEITENELLEVNGCCGGGSIWIPSTNWGPSLPGDLGGFGTTPSL
ncbi:MAG: hypothetical protein HUJ68_03910, partial [Clostridia bacterium]|nr:hypothetical protein [Clostridia bacterium]